MKKEKRHIENDSKKRNWESIIQKVNSGKDLPDYIELPSISTPSIKPRINFLIRIAAMLIFIFGITVLIRNIAFGPEQLIVYGNDLKLNEPYKLDDGSLVYLNGNSELCFSKKFGQNDRKISLKGEAFFEVERNEELPFIITSYNTTIQVLGTSFNVFSDQTKQVRVSVVSGVVEFSPEKKENLVRLEAGEQGSYNPEHASIEKGNIENQNFLAWKTGILVFKETPLSEAFSLLENQYSKVFVFENEQKDLPALTTMIDNQPLEAVLEELNLLLNTKNEIKNDTIFFKPSN